MRSKTLALSACAAGLALTGANVQAAPVIANSAGKPGLHAPFANSAAVNIWGKETLVAGYGFDTFSGTSVNNPNGILRYETTLDNGSPTVTPMSTAEDWMFSITMSHFGTEANDFYFVGKANEGTGSEVRIFSLQNTGNGNAFKLFLGPTQVELADLGTMDSGGEQFHDIIIHYQAATQSYDAWFDDVQVANDIVNPNITDHGIDYFSIDDFSGSNDKYRQIRIGQVVPEPSSLACIGLAALAFVRRRKNV